MTIDERIEKLTERHEALTQTAELMAAENRDRDLRFSKQMDQLGKQMGEVMEGLARLLHVAEIHEQRIGRIEKQ